MILHCNYEELRALVSGSELLTGSTDSPDAAVAAPCRTVAQVEALLPRLSGDLNITTLADQRTVRAAIAAICEGLRSRMDDEVLAHNPAHETAVTLYFEYAHARTVLDRVERMGATMEAMIELITGAPADDASAGAVAFPD